MDTGLIALIVAFIIAILFILFAFYLLRNTVNLVQQGFVGVVTRLGEFRAIHEPGLVDHRAVHRPPRHGRHARDPAAR